MPKHVEYLKNMKIEKGKLDFYEGSCYVDISVYNTLYKVTNLLQKYFQDTKKIHSHSIIFQNVFIIGLNGASPVRI